MKIVIQGAGEVGSHLARLLRNESHDITVIDDNPERINRLGTTLDIRAILSSSPSSLKAFRDARVHEADLFISVVPSVSQEGNIVSAILAKKLGAKKVTARIDDDEFLSQENKVIFNQMEIENMFYPERLAADEAFELLKHFASSETDGSDGNKLEIETFRLEEEFPFLDSTIEEFSASFAGDGIQFRVVAISRNGTTIIPKRDTQLLFNDIIYLTATQDSIVRLRKHLGRDNVEIDKVMILGGTRIAELTADKLSKKISTVKIIEKDKERAMVLSEKLDDNVIVVVGDGRNPDFLLEEGIKDYDAFLALTDNDEANVLACVTAKKFNSVKTIAEVENIEYIHLAEEMGVDSVINKKLITASSLFKYTLSDRARKVKYLSGTDAEELEYVVKDNTAITKAPVSALAFPKDAVIGGIVRGKETILAVGGTVIEKYDRVTVFTMPQSVKEVDEFFK
ncbi:MAG: Trk system potassium transporter TrkA [Bacteroidales bacterium]|nr:Trk system potassium transporter TrkA [Bacteroidales bacterium]